MRQTSKVEGTKIAQAAKDLNVTSVTIRRYLTEFGIDTTSDDNGIKVLPDIAMEELKEVRRLKEEGLTNPKVMEILEEKRSHYAAQDLAAAPSTPVKTRSAASRARGSSSVASVSDEVDMQEDINEENPDNKKPVRQPKAEIAEPLAVAAETTRSDEDTPVEESLVSADDRPKHSLTCQTCSKTFEHMNPRLRDCLDCYRTKRKERRRGGADKHKNVIQHPLAQQAVANKSLNIGAQPMASTNYVPVNGGETSSQILPPQDIAASPHQLIQIPAMQKGPVRSYRKAIEETRHITGSLKRRLERPDLPEGERRWLEQIYAYQLILHQGWRHLSDYKTATQQQAKTEE